MMKKLLCLMLAAFLLISMTACGGSSQDTPETDVPKSEETGTAGSNIPLKDNAEEAETQIIAAMQTLLEEAYGDKIDDVKINVEKIYTVEDEQATEVLKDYNLGPDEVAFEVRYDLHPTEGVDVNELMAATGEYDEESGWVKDKFNLGILRPTEDGSYTITDFGTGW
ncbi:MAG: hypothetical protein IJH43_06880 [Mogibacterium sp.]|nr:hypothetical protein [Mogibacterium sp.]